jgi:hypothetical protein
MLEIKLLFWALMYSIGAFVYCSILTDAGMILNPWYNWLDRKIGPSSGDCLAENPKGRAEWLFKPLVGCCKCVAGQFGLWGYLIQFRQEYNLAHHILFITFAIYLIKFIAQAYQWNRTSL